MKLYVFLVAVGLLLSFLMAFVIIFSTCHGLPCIGLLIDIGILITGFILPITKIGTREPYKTFFEICDRFEETI